MIAGGGRRTHRVEWLVDPRVMERLLFFGLVVVGLTVYVLVFVGPALGMLRP
jgi:hypothetical protein